MPAEIGSGKTHGLFIVQRLILLSGACDPSPNVLDPKELPDAELDRSDRGKQ
jgi:hypothetical protein